MRLLLIADDPAQSASLTRLFNHSGFITDSVATAEDAIAALRLAPYDAIILDVATYDPCHSEVLRLIRLRDAQRRVLVLSDNSTAQVHIDALNRGADDFLVKPFTAEELLARLRALLRRPSQVVDPVMRAGNIALDTAVGAVHVDGVAVRLTRREFAILEVLVRNKDGLVARERLEHAVFSFDATVTPNALEVAISRLRRSLALHDATLTVVAQRGSGYTLAPRQVTRPGAGAKNIILLPRAPAAGGAAPKLGARPVNGEINGTHGRLRRSGIEKRP
ncbi:MAG: response regulator transcription factor [Rhodospirillales bacterium]|nr:response regulator transcription factor [Rhodospirillales bacterium]